MNRTNRRSLGSKQVQSTGAGAMGQVQGPGEVLEAGQIQKQAGTSKVEGSERVQNSGSDQG